MALLHPSFPCAMVVPGAVFITILFFVGDSFTRRSLRATSASMHRAGELGRLVVQGRVEALNGAPSSSNAIFNRLRWWCPWVGQLRVVSDPTASPMALAHFKHFLLQFPRPGRSSSGNRVVEVRMCSSRRIMYCEYIRGTGWVHRYTLWAGHAIQCDVH